MTEVRQVNRMGLVLLIVALGGCATPSSQSRYSEISRRLDDGRAGIMPPLGATTYELGHQRLVNQPGGENRSLAGSLAQLPGVTVLPGGQLSVRGQ